MLGQNEQLQIYQDRFRYLYLILIGASVILVSRLWYLQILRGTEFRQFAEENRLKKIKIEAPRGMVFDRNRSLLLDNHPTFLVTITPQYFKAAKPDVQEKILEKLSRIIKVNATSIKELLFKFRKQPAFQPITIKRSLSMDEVAMIEMEKLELPGVEVAVGIRRTNVNGEIGSHLLGYIAEIDADELPRLTKESKFPYQQGDFIGKSGLEQQWESVLRGEDGIEYVEVDALGRRKLKSVKTKDNVISDIKPKPAVPGKNIVLTVDEDLQKVAAETFQRDNNTGAVVALDPNNGEILAMLSWPGFNSSEFSVGIRPDYWKELSTDEDKPLRDKTIVDHYSPGSTFKIISSIAGLEEGLINAQTVVNAASVWFGGRAWHDWKKEGHGPSDIIRALYRSVDVYYYKLGMRMDIDRLSYYADLFGFGQKTGVRLPGEIPGVLPSTAWKKKYMGTEWYPGETLSVIIGQSYLTATPIQLANMIAGIANGSRIYKPRLIHRIEEPDGKLIEDTKPQVLHEFSFKEENLKLVRKGLQEVIENDQGTARAQMIPGIHVAGKTGTAQVIRFTQDTYFKDCRLQERKFRHHGLFVAYAPVEDPKIAVAVVAEHSCSGANGAAPVAMAVIKKYLEKLDPQKYGPEALKQAKANFYKTGNSSGPKSIVGEED